MQILGICGAQGSGKTTLAKLLCDRGWQRTAFTTPLKNMITSLLAFQNVDFDTMSRMMNGDLKGIPTPYLGNQSPRYCMQKLGTEWRDMVSKTLWSDIWKNNINSAFKPDSKILVDDLRFIHEEAAIRSLNGKIVKVIRNGYWPGTHQSEIEYLSIKCDLEITNNENPENMLKQLSTLIEY